MKLSYQSMTEEKASWEKAGVCLPTFDMAQMREKTAQQPTWVHFGAGNIFRGFIATLQQSLLNEGMVSKGIIAADTFDFDIIDKIYTPFDDMTMMVTLLPDGTMEKQVIASVARSLRAGSAFAQDLQALRDIFENPSLQMVSFTITEKGYALENMAGETLPVVISDLANGPKSCAHAMSLVTSLLFARYEKGAYPVAMVSMDNCSHNGEKLRAAVLTVAKAWQKNGFVDEGFVAWLSNEEQVSFPWSMIDKITPRPAQVVQDELEKLGIENMAPIVTEKNTFIAPFVNAEKPQYLVVEDRFPNGRPPLEKAGVYMTDLETVNNTEKMKVTTCLNPLHTALAVYGCLLNMPSIAAEMQDAHLKKLVEKIGYDEGLPVVVDPKIIKPNDFIHEVIDSRLPNPFIPDTPQRIATDTSQKVAIRFGETIKSYAAHPSLSPESLTYIPLAIAGWIRYLIGVDDCGAPMQCSSDPMLSMLQEKLAGVELGKPDSIEGKLDEILSNEMLFGIDLVRVGLAEKITGMVKQMLAGEHAVRACLAHYL